MTGTPIVSCAAADFVQVEAVVVPCYTLKLETSRVALPRCVVTRTKNEHRYDACQIKNDTCNNHVTVTDRSLQPNGPGLLCMLDDENYY